MDAGRHHGVILIKHRQTQMNVLLMVTHINTVAGGMPHLNKTCAVARRTNETSRND